MNSLLDVLAAMVFLGQISACADPVPPASDLATRDAAEPDLWTCQPGNGSCDPECAGSQSPTYCLAGATDCRSCGACAVVGKVCTFFEADLTCGSDHKWYCSHCGGSNCKDACGPRCVP